MTGIRLKYVHSWVDKRDGGAKPRFYFRRAGVKRTPLPGLPGSPEFMAAYAALLGNAPPLVVGQHRGTVGSVAAAVTGYFGSAEFAALAHTSRVSRRQILERFRREHGDQPIAGLEPRHVHLMMNARAGLPGAALNFLTSLRALMRYSIAAGLRAGDPTVGIKAPKLRVGGHYSWNEDDIAAFAVRHPVGTKARLALALLLYTGQRRADVITFGRQYIRDGLLHLRQGKTGKVLAIPIHPDLQEVLSATPTDNLTFLVTEHGRPWHADGFTHWFKKRCAEAGLPKQAAVHRLRKAACRRLAEAGCTMKQIAAISGHASLRELARYTDAAEQIVLAKQAMAAISRTPIGNPERRVANQAKKP